MASSFSASASLNGVDRLAEGAVAPSRCCRSEFVRQGSLAKGERRALAQAYHHTRNALPARIRASCRDYRDIPFAAAIAFLTPDFACIALIFARCSFERGLAAAFNRPCCW